MHGNMVQLRIAIRHSSGKLTAMKYLVSLIVATSLLAAFGQQNAAAPKGDKTGGAPLLYLDGGGFMIDSPKDWVVDHEGGKSLGTCCVFYPKRSTWDDAETVMYPSIVKKGPGKQTLREFMESDLAEFRKHDPEMSYEDAEDVLLKQKRLAKVRMFHNVNHGSFEAVAYIDEEKIIAVVVLSSKTKEDLKKTMPLLKTALGTYVFMDVRVENSSPNKEEPTPTKN